MIRRPPRSTLSSSSAASDVYKRQLFPFRQFPNDVVDEVGTGCGVQILRPYQGWRRRLLLPGHFGSISILEVRDLATVPGTSPYARQASNVIGDRLTSRTPDPHRSSNVFVTDRSARDQLLGPQPPQETAVQVQSDGFAQIGWVTSHQDVSFDLQKQLGQTLAIGWFVAVAVQLHTSALRHLAPLTVPEQGIENFRTLNQSFLPGQEQFVKHLIRSPASHASSAMGMLRVVFLDPLPRRGDELTGQGQR